MTDWGYFEEGLNEIMQYACGKLITDDNLEKEAYLDVRTVRDYNGDLMFLVGNEYVIKELKIPSNHLEEDFDGIVTAYVVFEKRKAGTSKEKEMMQLPSVEKTGEWTPMKEKPPEVGDNCLVTTWWDDELIVDEDYYDSFGWDDYGDKVIAWMPLPEPYKEADR